MPRDLSHIGVKKFECPFPYVRLENVIPTNVYDMLKFPVLTKRENTRAGWDLFKGEKAYETFFSSDENWRMVREQLDSDAFLRFVLRIFESELHLLDIDVETLSLIDFIESPAQMSMGKIAWGEFDGKIFSRFDLQMSDGSTLRRPHVDHARRLVGGVLFFCDEKQEELDGGQFGLWVDDDFKNDRTPHSPRLLETLPVLHNTMYVFLNRNDAFHAPTPLIKAAGTRRWAYFSISGKQNVWRSKQDRAIPSLINTARDVKRRLAYNLSNRGFSDKI